MRGPLIKHPLSQTKVSLGIIVMCGLPEAPVAHP
jgi:hypothetical protein